MRKILIFAVGFLAILTLAYFYAMSDLNPIYSETEFANLENDLRKARKENLYSIDSLYNLLDNEEKRCPCAAITNSADPYRHQISPKPKFYHWKIEKEYGRNLCLKLDFLNSSFLNATGVKKAALFYYKKSIEELNEKEKIALIVIHKNPALYNPLRRKSLVERKTIEYQKQIERNKNGR